MCLLYSHLENQLDIERFLKLKKSNSLGSQPSLKLQDLVKYALLETQEPIQNNNKNKIGAKNMSIPKGLDKLNYLLKILEEGGNIDEAYAQIANCS